ARGRIRAPAPRKSSSGMDDPSPAPAWTYTSCPERTSSFTPAGVIATRYSWFLTSRGTPTFMGPPPQSGLRVRPRCRDAGTDPGSPGGAASHSTAGRAGGHVSPARGGGGVTAAARRGHAEIGRAHV